MLRSYIFQTYIVTAFISSVINVEILPIPSMDDVDTTAVKRKSVSPCVACQILVKSFLTALEETTRQSFAGGDADWEREKLGTYENSELRFIEIQEILCSDAKIGQDQCYNLAEKHESKLEDWFYTKRKEEVNLYESLCISDLKVCCPNNTYGPKCIPCPGGTENPCGGHGKCMKGGTREEPASCDCDAGYTGELCENCEEGHYAEIGSPVLSCQLCDKACKGHCRGPGPKNCEVCSSGYHFSPNKGCIEDSEDEMTSTQPDGTVSEKASVEYDHSDFINTSSESSDTQSGKVEFTPHVEDSSVDNDLHFEL